MECASTFYHFNPPSDKIKHSIYIYIFGASETKILPLARKRHQPRRHNMFFSLQNSYKYSYWEKLHILLIYPKHNIQFLQSPIHHPVGISTPWLLMLLSAPVGPLLPAQWWNLWRNPDGRCIWDVAEGFRGGGKIHLKV